MTDADDLTGEPLEILPGDSAAAVLQAVRTAEFDVGGLLQIGPAGRGLDIPDPANLVQGIARVAQHDD